MELSGSIALVTGGSRGIGKNVVQSVAGRGADVVFTYRSSEADAEALVAEVEGMGRRAASLLLEVGDAGTFGAFAEGVRGVLRGWGTERFRFLVNNAGLGLYASIADTTEARFDEIMDVHVKGPFFLTQRLLPLIAAGLLVLGLLASEVAHRFGQPEQARDTPVPTHAASTASKSAAKAERVGSPTGGGGAPARPARRARTQTDRRP